MKKFLKWILFPRTDFVKKKSEHNFGFVKSPISAAMTKTYLRDKKLLNGFKNGDCTDVSPDSWGCFRRTD